MIGLEVEEYIKKRNEETENYLMEFLKSKGYRPKKTPEYIKGLNKRLRAKGLQLIAENMQDEYINQLSQNEKIIIISRYNFDIREIKTRGLK